MQGKERSADARDFYLTPVGMPGKLQGKPAKAGHLVGKVRLVHQDDGGHSVGCQSGHLFPPRRSGPGVVQPHQGQAGPADFPYVRFVLQFSNASRAKGLPHRMGVGPMVVIAQYAEDTHGCPQSGQNGGGSFQHLQTRGGGHPIPRDHHRVGVKSLYAFHP